MKYISSLLFSFLVSLAYSQPGYKNKDVCQLPLEHGTCKNGFEVWGFDAKTGQCIKFSSCNNEGDKNSFFTEADCETLCETDLCKMSIATGLCRAHIRRYGFNEKSGKCEMFIYGGCGGNPNNYETIMECEERCGRREEE
ncbi:Kunitz-type [Armadillidium nasatum]|uniref:Kunitz-type n=1 Tax=Armadillidium nasatum TaxID=96803 RepID=A0A5N5SS66_9CRUS|nr:Kunitz-type [Armadillidium nasatum]